MSLLPPAAAVVPRPTTPARLLPPAARQQLALEAPAGQPITARADQPHVRRKVVDQLRHHAHDALDRAFAPPPTEPPPRLVGLPITTTWLRQLVLGLTLVCHGSSRGVRERLNDLFDYPLSVAAVHHSLHQAVASARQVTAPQDLAAVRRGAHDQIFQAGRPVLVGADVASTYCYLRCPEGHRDADTWGVRLLELTERGFRPDAAIADSASGLRAGHAEALPDVPCRGDVFHALQTATPLARYVEKRAYQAIATRRRLEGRPARTEHRHGRKDLSLAAQLRYAREAATPAVILAEQVAALIGWLRQDVLAVRRPGYANRCALYDGSVAALRRREPHGPHRSRPVRCLPENQRDDLLAFAPQLDADVQALAAECAVPAALVEEVRHVLSVPSRGPPRWPHDKALWDRGGCRYGVLRAAVAELLGGVVRASSVMENLNSRWRNYVFLRRPLGGDYLALLQFFWNHRRLVGREHRGRAGTSAAELLTGQSPPRWLELLGYTRFSQN
jgi:hypothetical protein